MAVVPAVRVDLYTGEVAGPYLTLDDPVKGELDEPSWPLYDGPAPELTVALEADAYAYGVRRGRSSELDDVSTGTLAVEFRNHSGAFVPTSLVDAGIYDDDGELLVDDEGVPITDTWAIYGYNIVTPGRRVRLYLDEVVVYDGRVEDWELDYDVNGDAIARLVAVDALGVLAQAELELWATTAQTAGERFVAVLIVPRSSSAPIAPLVKPTSQPTSPTTLSKAAPMRWSTSGSSRTRISATCTRVVTAC